MVNGILKQIEIGLVRFSPSNTRYGKDNNITPLEQGSLNELAENIKQYGVIEPLIVMENGKGFELVSGERRLRASNIAQLKFVPCIVRKTLGDDDVRAIQVAENLHREDLNPIDEAHAFRQYFKEGDPDIEALSEATNKPKAYILRRVRLAELDGKTQALVASGKISASHGIELLRVNKAERQNITKWVVKENVSVADMTEQITGSSWQRLSLSDALFDIEDTEAQPRSCVGCLYHGKHQKEMFGEMNLKVDADNDQCFDSDCYHKKNWKFVKLIAKRKDAKVITEEGRLFRDSDHQYETEKHPYGRMVADYFTTDAKKKKYLKFVYKNETATILIRHEKKGLKNITVFTSDFVALKKEFPDFGLDQWQISQRNEKKKEIKAKAKESGETESDFATEERAEKEITRFNLYADIDRREFMIDRIGKSKPSAEILRLNAVRLALCESVDYSLGHSSNFLMAIGEALPENHELKKGFNKKVIERADELGELTAPFSYHMIGDGEYGERITDKERAVFQKELDKLPAIPNFHSNSEVWKFTEGMSEKLVITLLGVASQRHLIGVEDAPQHEYGSRKGYSTQMLENIADTLKIDAEGDMKMTDDFLKAQTKNRLLQIAWEVGVFGAESGRNQKILKGKKGEIIEAIQKGDGSKMILKSQADNFLLGNSPSGYATGELDREADKKVETKFKKFTDMSAPTIKK